MKKSKNAERRRGLLLSFLTMGIVGSFVVAPTQFRSTASTVNNQATGFQTVSHNEGFENYDIRTDKKAAQVLSAFRASAGKNDLSANARRTEILSAEQSLRARVPNLKVEYNEDLKVPEVIAPDVKLGAAKLTGSSAAKHSEVLRSFIKTNNDLVGLSDNQVDSLKVTADYTNPDGNLSFAHLEQFINGIPVFRGEVKAGFTKSGEIIRVINNLAPGLEYDSLSNDFGSPEAAVRAAFNHVSRKMNSADLQANGAASNENKVTFGEGDWATTAEKMYFPTESGVARAAWRVLIWEDVAAYYVIVDAETGQLLWRKNLSEDQTQSATYNVYANTTSMVKTLDNPAPLTPGPISPNGTQAPMAARTNVTLIGNEAPYTFNNKGWITDGNNTTDGNAVEAGVDRVAPNGVDAPVTGTNRVFNFAYNPAPGNPAPGDDPLNPTFQNGASVQMFYLMNRYHDEMYRLGFTEAARNFQNENFTGQGIGNDRVSAEGQDSSGTNNANFNTPADGGRGRMQMYLWTGPTPDYDGTIDGDIIIHEVTHGTSNRLHGNASGLSTNMSRGMGEGWGDFYGHTMLSEPTDPINGIYTTGGYATYLGASGYTSNYYYGIRRFPKAVMAFTGGPNNRPHNPLTFADLNAGCNLSDGAYGRGPFGVTQCDAVHNAGEIWSSALWEVRAKYVERLGFTEGNRRILQFVTDGMKLAPIGPTFLQERDSIIAAAQASGTAADVADLWAGFAIRGMGFSARVVAPGSPAVVVEAFNLPNVVLTPNYTYTIITGDGDAFPEPGETLALSIPLTNTTGDTISGVTLQVNGGTAVSYGDIANGATVSRTVNYVIPANQPCGSSLTLTFTVNSNRGQFTETRALTIGAPVVGATENFDNVTAPALPANWASAQTGTNTPWVTSTTTPSSAPNAAYVAEPPTAGGADLTSPVYNINAGAAAVNFRVKFSSEDGWDGAVLEVKIGNGTFQDILQAGGSFSTGGYNGTLGAGTGNPLANRPAWTGEQGSYMNVSATLPAAANGQQVQLRWRVGQDDNTAPANNGFWLDNVEIVTSYDCTSTSTAPTNSRIDFDGDGKTDVSVFRNGNWFQNRSTQGFINQQWGSTSDTLTPGDFDGDNKTDVAIFRLNASGSDWFILRSSNGTIMTADWGTTGDIPVVGDYNGDNLEDVAIFRPSSGLWAILPTGGSSAAIIQQFGANGDRPVQGDFDGDNKADLAVFRNGNWLIQKSTGGTQTINWGLSSDILVPGDFDNDNKTDAAVYRGGQWYIQRSSNGSMMSMNFGLSTDIPVVGDYDGDGADDIAVFRDGNWYYQRSTAGFGAFNFGLSGDTALPSLYNR